MTERLLLLAGTAETRELIPRLLKLQLMDIVASFAGVTSNPSSLGVKTRTGGFGGVVGLTEFIEENQISMILDATHPFATQIKEHVNAASQRMSIPSAHFIRPTWKADSADKWHIVDSVETALKFLPVNSTPFLAVGKKEFGTIQTRSDLNLVVRMMENPANMCVAGNIEIIRSHPNADWRKETELFKLKRITHLVARNSGGKIGYAKILAARKLSLPVILIDRPPLPSGIVIEDVESSLNWVRSHLAQV